MKLRKEIATAIAGVLGGIYTLFYGLLDPFVLFEIGGWFPIAKVLTRSIGPTFIPSVPWSTIGAIASLVFLAVSLSRLNNRRKSHNDT
jgi:VIT1/CCC1 family predicted Fe2+/Mn2+ transporter